METKKITFQILFTSDIHGSFRDFNYTTNKEIKTGFSRIASLMKKDKENFPGTTIICDCGDSIQGNGTGELVKSGKYKPYPLFAAFESVGYDIVALGNHEFNFGLKEIYSTFEGYKGTKLCGNVYKDGKLLEGFEPYRIIEIPNGPRVAFIGMVSPNIDVWDKANIEEAEIETESAAIETQRVIKTLKENDLADLFVAVQHMDEKTEVNREGSGAKDVVEMNPELAVFLGAHYHTIKGSKEKQHVLCNSVKFAENLNSAMSYGQVLITATEVDGKWQVLNKTGDYDESDVKTDIICSDENTPNDPGVLEVTEEAHQYIKKYMSETVIGWLPEAPLLPAPEIKGTHEGVLKSNSLIYFVSKVMLHYSKADIVGVPLNHFEANCSERKITAGGISQLYVYDNNTLHTVGMTGAQIIQWMEWSYAFYGTDLQGGKPAVNLETDLTIPYGTRKVYLHDQFSGINYTVDLTKPVGQRIHVISMKNGEDFCMDKEYIVATTNYRASTNLVENSDDGIFKPGQKTARPLKENIESPKGNSNMLDLIAEYISELKDQAVLNEAENNWEFINLNWNKKWRNLAIELINNGTIEDYNHQIPVTIEMVKSYLK
ncbi:bifunctional UDP-sugar hydrolase/5'-nucleotidase [Bacteroides sp. 519]|uniref:bifunctional metallophosphatase/5'-nucleotidase n=1 Tax=Bacteroides sp. 519 TaxID=2302937 RepID=UPI0013D8BAD1|nr:5'-nucleotidase C-terminal domain-containing protein [Bacteroides sp. 519]NDV58724.1 hypothetical protein [Bacteroides sp. 519]